MNAILLSFLMFSFSSSFATTQLSFDCVALLWVQNSRMLHRSCAIIHILYHLLLQLTTAQTLHGPITATKPTKPAPVSAVPASGQCAVDDEDDKIWSMVNSPKLCPPTVASSSLSLSSGWSSDNDYIFIERLGRRPSSAASNSKYYGSTAAVYRTRLTDDAKLRAIIDGVPANECNTELAFKIIFKFEGYGRI